MFIQLNNLTVHINRLPMLTIDQMGLPPSGIYAILGPSGCGKSSLLTLLSGLHDPALSYSGDLIEHTHTPVRYAMVWQKPTVFPCSIFDNLWVAYRSTLTAQPNRLHPSNWSRFIKRQHRGSLYRALETVGLDQELGHGWAERHADTLSGGQKQRLCIAMGLLKQADVLLLDEPTSSLDPIATQKIEETLRALSKKHLIVLVTHSIGQAKRLADLATVICHCTERNLSYACETGLASDVLNRPKTLSCKAFIEAETG